MEIMSYNFVMPRGYSVLDHESHIEVTAGNGRTFMLLVPPHTRYGDVFNFKAGPFDFNIDIILISRAQ
jgi:hypothetical protein